MSWPLPQTAPELLRLAYGYPYDAPPGGYLLRDGQLAPLEEAVFKERIPVLAHGSNRAPEQLARKFPPHKFPGGEIPVTRGWLSDHAVVYCACLTRYGACPSLLHHRPGSSARLSINWLTQDQLAFMHLTEGAYGFGTLTADFQPEDGPVPDRICLYHGTHGALLLGGAPVGLSAVEGRGSALPQRRHQRQVLGALQQLAGVDGPLDDFVLQMIRHPQARAQFLRRLGNHSLSNALPGFRLLEEAAPVTL